MSAVMADPAAVVDAPVRRPKKKIIVIGAAVLALSVALGGGAIVVLKQRAAHAAAAANGDDDVTPGHGGPAHIDPKNAPVYLPLDPFVVNLADKEADRYAQIGITFELDSGVSGDQIKAYMPAIRNAILMILANKSSKELHSREGKEQLAQDIMREAVRPMGIELAAPEPVTMAAVTPTAATPAAAESATSSAAASASAAASSATSAPDAAAIAKAKAVTRRRLEAQRNPIQHVHFSSFIIQ